MTEPTILLILRQDHPVVQFAAEELRGYFMKMGCGPVEINQGRPRPEPCWPVELGLFSEFDIAMPNGLDPDLDDAVQVDMTGEQGLIAGSNPRSVLMAVYRLLEKAGCCFIRPGKDGEIIPQVSRDALRVAFQEQPAYRHRGLCIEGAVSLEHMLDSVAWAPKVGLNAYFLEFMIPFTFFDRWYRHLRNPFWPPEPVTPEQVAGFRVQIEHEIARRGLAYHNPGHGWTCEPFGLAGLAWDPQEYHLPESISQYLAEIDGVRGVYKGIPLNTQLCYSNPQARQQVVAYAVAYTRANPGIDYLHVWLGDAVNNICECPACQDQLPADQYVQLLNEIDAAFRENNITCRIVFIAYLDLLWPPQVQRFHHPENFVLLFAPISRSYSQSYDDDTAGLALPAYRRNQNVLPSNIRENLVFLQAWQQFFQGDSFTYEYYFMWDCYLDPGYTNTARILHEDVQKLRRMGLNGIMSDQSQRAYFPTAFGMHVMARALWNPEVDFDALASAYFHADFGEAGPQVLEYLARLSDLFDPPYQRGDYDRRDEHSHVWLLNGPEALPNQQAAARLAQIPAWVDAFRPAIARGLQSAEPCRARSWQILAQHAEVVTGLARAFEARALGDRQRAAEEWSAVKTYVQKHEPELHKVLDVFEFITVLGARFA